MANTDGYQWRLVGTGLTAGATDPILPVTSSHFYFVLNDAGSGECSIPLKSAAASMVTEGKLAVLYYRGSIHASFFVENIRKRHADAGEAAGQYLSMSGRGGMILLERAEIWSGGTNEKTREFTAVAKASILRTLILEAQARGGLSTVTMDFDETNDSDAVAWTDSETYKLNVGMKLIDLVHQFAETGVDFEMNYSGTGFVLSAYKNGIGTDISATTYFRTGTNCQEVDTDQRGNDIKNSLLVAYKNGEVLVEDSTSISAYGRREEVINADFAQTATSATTYGAAVLATKKDPLVGRTIRVYDGVPPYIFVNYILGDTIALDIEGTVTDDRILGIQCGFDGNEYSNIVIELNSLMLDKKIKMAQDIERLKNQMQAAHDAGLLEVSFWANLAAPEFSLQRNSIVSGDKFYVACAYALWMYDIPSGIWSKAPGVEGVSTVNMIAAIGTDIYIAAFGFCYKYDTLTDTRTTIGIVAVGVDPYALKIVAIGTNVYVTGDFETIDGVAIDVIAKYNTLTDTWSDVSGTMTGMLTGNYSLYLYGQDINSNIWRWDNSSWTQLGTWTGGLVMSVAEYSGNLLVCHTTAGISTISEWDGVSWTTFVGNITGTIYGIAVYLTDIYVYGNFTDIGNYIARYSGGYWSALGTGLNNFELTYVPSISIYDRDIYVTGDFTTAGDKVAVGAAAYINNFENLIEYLENSGSFDMGAAIHNAAVSAITDTDEMGFWEATVNTLRKITWANIEATLKTYFDTLYVALTGDQTVAGVKSFTSAIVAGNHAVSLGGEGDLEMFAPTGANPAIIQHAFGGVVGFVGMTADGTEASPTAVPSGKVLYNVAPYAHDGVGYYADAHLKNVAAEAHDATHHGTKWTLWATPLASTAEQLIATIAPPSAQYKYLISSAAPFAYAESVGALNIASGKTLTVSNSVTISGTDGGITSLVVTSGKTLTLTAVDNWNLTVPGTGVALVKATALTAGYIPFGIANNLVGENAKLFWDNADNILDVDGIVSSTNSSFVSGKGAFIALGANPSIIQRDQRITDSGFAHSISQSFADNLNNALSSKLLDYGVYGNMNSGTTPPSTYYAYFSVGVSSAYNNTWMRLYDGTSKIVSFDGIVGFGTILPGGRLHALGATSGITAIFNAGATTPGDILQLRNSSETVLTSFNSTGLLKVFAGIADGVNITVQTTTGTKFGASDTAKISVYNATPIIRQNHIVDATDAASAITQINAVLIALENFGILKIA